jgi:predicted transcriptional regulator
VYQTFALSQFVRLTIVTLASHSCKIQKQTIAQHLRDDAGVAMRAIAHELGTSKNTVLLAKKRIEEYEKIVRKPG